MEVRRGHIYTVRLTRLQLLVSYGQCQLTRRASAASCRISRQVNITDLHSDPVHIHITTQIRDFIHFSVCVLVEESPACVVRQLRIRTHHQLTQLQYIISIDPAIAVHICRDSLILALQQFFLQYVTLDIDQVMRRHTIRKTGILAGYQTHIRSILDGEVVSSVTTRHHRHRTTATQYCFHLNISYGITIFGRDRSLNQTDISIISAFIQRTLRIDHRNHFLDKTILTLRQVIRTAPVNRDPRNLVLYVVRIVHQMLYFYFMTGRDRVAKLTQKLLFHLQLTDRIQQIVGRNLSGQAYRFFDTTQILRHIKHTLPHRTSRFNRDRLRGNLLLLTIITSTPHPESTRNRTQTALVKINRYRLSILSGTMGRYDSILPGSA